MFCSIAKDYAHVNNLHRQTNRRRARSFRIGNEKQKEKKRGPPRAGGFFGEGRTSGDCVPVSFYPVIEEKFIFSKNSHPWPDDCTATRTRSAMDLRAQSRWIFRTMRNLQGPRSAQCHCGAVSALQERQDPTEVYFWEQEGRRSHRVRFLFEPNSLSAVRSSGNNYWFHSQ